MPIGTQMIWLDPSYIESNGCVRFLLFLFTLKFELLIPVSTLTNCSFIIGLPQLLHNSSSTTIIASGIVEAG